MQNWLDEYAESHQNSTNKIVHWICVPLIMFSILGLFWLVKFNLGLPAAYSEYQNLASVLIILALLFYARISVPMAIGMLFVTAIMVLGIRSVESLGSNVLLITCIVVFVLAWIAQFIGHNIEGKKPKFLKDVQFLLIGPAWILGFIYNKLGIRY